MAYYKCGSIHPTQNSNVVVDNVSGAIANFNTPLSLPLIETKFGVKATQDLNGQSGPYPAGGSAQIWDEETEFGTFDTETGEKTPNNNLLRSVTPIPVSPNTTYLRRMNESLGCRIFQYDSNMDFISQDVSSERLLTFTTANNCAFINITFQKAATDVGINYPATDTAYHPYSNICPINGWDEIKVGYVNFNQLARLDTSPRQGLTATMDADGVISLSGVTTNRYSNITKTITPLVNHIYFIIKSVISNPNNINFNWSFLNAVKSPYTPGTSETQYTLDKVVSESGASTGISGFAVDTDFTDVKIKVVCIDLTQALGKEKADYLHELGGAGVAIARQLFTKDYYPYNEGGTLVSLSDVNGKSVCPVDTIQLNNTYYGGRFIQDKSGKRKFVVTHEKAAYNLADQHYTNENGFDGWIIYRATRAEQTPNSPTGKLCNCCPEYKYADSTLGRPHYYISAGAFVMYLPENTYRNGYLEYAFPLETPFTIDLPDGTPFKSLPGVNNIFADTGDTAVKFGKIRTTG